MLFRRPAREGAKHTHTRTVTLKTLALDGHVSCSNLITPLIGFEHLNLCTFSFDHCVHEERWCSVLGSVYTEIQIVASWSFKKSSDGKYHAYACMSLWFNAPDTNALSSLSLPLSHRLKQTKPWV